MKNSKLRRALLLVASAVLLVSISVSATLAYLTSKTEVVTNTFSVGNVKIDLDESDVDDTDGDGKTDDRDKVNNYHLKPNDEHKKDPIVWLDEKSEDCYLFVEVVNPLAPIESDADNENTIVEQMAVNGWLPLTQLDNTTVVPNIYFYADANGSPKSVSYAATSETGVPVFEKVYISEKVHNNDTNQDDFYLDKYQGKQITVTAYAIQSSGWTAPHEYDLWKALNGIQ